jgi:Uma2 family endonuclease
MVVTTLEFEISRLPKDALYEVVNGKVREIPRMGAFATILASRLMAELSRAIHSNPTGELAIEILFLLDAASNLQRRPDLAYVSHARLPGPFFPPGEDPPVWDVVPNLAVEVISPSNTAQEIDEKIADYFRHGVELVWVVYPLSRKVYVYESVTRVTVLLETDDLTDGSVLPGFSIPIASLFVDRLAPR